MSEHYLEQLVSPLRNARLVKSIRGAYGGYVLAHEPNEITAGDIIRVLEGPISPVEVIENEEPAKRALWIRIRDAVKTYWTIQLLKTWQAIKMTRIKRRICSIFRSEVYRKWNVSI